MWIRPEGGPFLNAIAWEILTPTQVMFTYEDDVTACTLWQIGDPAAWEWSDSGATVAPFEGSIG